VTPESKQKVVKEVRQFAKERDEQFARVKAHAERAIQGKIDAGAMLASPQKYLRYLFMTVGAEVVKAAAAEAKKIGDAHAERMVEATRSVQETRPE